MTPQDAIPPYAPDDAFDDGLGMAIAVLDGLPGAVYATDALGRLRFLNDAAAALWGQHPPLGTVPWPAPWRLLAPDGRSLSAEEAPVAQALRAGRPLHDLALLAAHDDGSRRLVSANPAPLRNAAGRIVGAFDLMIPEADHRDADADRAHLAAIVASSSDAIASKTLDGIVTSWNDSAGRIFGFTAEEMIGQSISRIIPPELRHEEAQILATLARGERVPPFDTVRIAKDGRRLDISLTISPLRDETGKVVGASKVARDITARKQAETLQRLLFHELNHRVKNMLATIQALASQSLRRSQDPAAFAESLGSRIRALALVHDLVVDEQLRGVGLETLLHALVPTGSGRVSLDAGPPVTLAPKAAEQLGLVLHELAANAVAYGALAAATPEGRLAIRWRVSPDNRLALEWGETGVPRQDATRRNGFGRTLIERTLGSVGGTASVVDNPDGLIARLDLPLDEARPAPINRAEPEATASTGTAPDIEGARILLVEDEPLVALDIESQLIALGCTVAGPAATPEKALALVEAGNLDAAFVDGNLGGRPVDAVSRALSDRGIPFAFVSGYGRDALPAAFQDAPLLAKPFSPDQLAATLRALLPR